MSDYLRNTDKWLDENATYEDVVVSSRARYARNLSGYDFASRGNTVQLQQVVDEIDSAIQKNARLINFQRIEIEKVTKTERTCLRESRLISPEVEKGHPSQVVFLSPDMNQSIMINEEDHIRIQAILPGLQIEKSLYLADQLDDALSENLTLAYSSHWGYLTACPTNTGTGLRVSVMIHLPALVLKQKIEDVLRLIQPFGLTVRGFYGENSEFSGDFFQLSNEVTLGKRELEIAHVLSQIVAKIIDQEIEARNQLFRENELLMTDFVWRSFGQLAYARRLETSEAMKLLSRIRLGISQGYFKDLTHKQLNQLIVAIQPGHIQAYQGKPVPHDLRDSIRATVIQNRLNHCASNN